MITQYFILKHFLLLPDFAPFQNTIQILFLLMTQQKNLPAMIYHYSYIYIIRAVRIQQEFSHANTGINIGHTNQTYRNLLASIFIKYIIFSMQFQCRRPYFLTV